MKEKLLRNHGKCMIKSEIIKDHPKFIITVDVKEYELVL